jgi:ribosome-associated protein
MPVDDEASQSTGSGQRFATDLDSLEREVVVETFRSPGPGGQRKNKKETAVRLTHPPSGVTVVASERRSQAMNREVAFERLRKRLERLNRPPKPRVKTRPSASALRKWEEEKKQLSEKKRSRTKPELPNDEGGD